MLFEKIISEYENSECPILLIDVSGSTGDKFKNKKTVRSHEFKLAFNICKNSNYKEAHIITWSDKAKLFENVKLESFSDIKKNTKSSGGTYLKSAIDLIKPEFFHKDKVTEVIIITDGEISDKKDIICEKLNELNKNKIFIKIIAVEPNNNDYLNYSSSIGNTLYKIIRDNNMSRLINRFSVYNRLGKEFVNMSNPTTKPGFLPFCDMMFPISDFNKFIIYISNEITNLLKEPSEKEPNKLSGKQLKFIQELSLTIYHLTKDKPYQYQLSFVELFCNMFKGTIYYEETRKILINEMNNHITGQISTFSELRKHRYTKIENTNIDLMTDTQKAICTNNNLTDNPNYSFLLMNKEDKHYIIKSYDDELNDINMGFTTYKHSIIGINNYRIPIMFDINSNNEAALQWMKFNYSRRLNISISNEYIYYYLMCDAYLTRNSEVYKLYEKYVNLALNDKKYGSEKTIKEEMVKNQSITIPFGILQDAIQYHNSNIKPLSLYYIICHKYLLPLLNNNSFIIENLRKFCLKDIMIDLNMENNENIDWINVEKLLDELNKESIEIISFNNKEKIIIKPHLYLDLNIECSGNNGHIIGDKVVCDLCNGIIEYIKIEKNDIVPDLLNIKDGYVFNLTKHINLGNLDGMPDDELLYVEKFNSEYESFSVENTMIIDPISNSRLKITTQQDFVNYAYMKYPFLKDINMNNIALCGGFVRSILLKQQMKDFDFFFHGLENDLAYIERLKTLAYDVIKSLKNVDPNYKFALFYKPMFNVLEMICYEDPSNFIQEDFSIDYFDKYKFKSMKKFYGTKDSKITKYGSNDKTIDKQDNEILDNELNESEEDESDSEEYSDSSDTESENSNEPENKKIDKKYYFEDNDEHGIKMKYRIQFIMCKYATLTDIIKSFDMTPSKTIFDGSKVYFTKKSLIAFQYMINEINLNGGNDLVKHRVNKYFKYGFAIVFPMTDRNWKLENFDNNYNQENIYYTGTNENLGPLSFKVRKVDNNMIYINHNSSLEQMLERNEKLEKKAKSNGDALYTSSLFCSFVAILRYAKIYDINYSFPQKNEVYELFDNDKIKLNKESIQLKFLEYQKTIYKSTDWYPKFVKSIILKNY